MSEPNLAQLVGRDIYLYISDPWELGSEPGTPPHEGRVIGTRAPTNELSDVVFRLAETVRCGEVPVDYFIARARHHGDRLESLLLGSSVLVGMVGTHDPPGPSDTALVLPRGGVPAIGTIVLSPSALQ